MNDSLLIFTISIIFGFLVFIYSRVLEIEEKMDTTIKAIQVEKQRKQNEKET